MKNYLSIYLVDSFNNDFGEFLLPEILKSFYSSCKSRFMIIRYIRKF